MPFFYTGKTYIYKYESIRALASKLVSVSGKYILDFIDTVDMSSDGEEVISPISQIS